MPLGSMLRVITLVLSGPLLCPPGWRPLVDYSALGNYSSEPFIEFRLEKNRIGQCYDYDGNYLLDACLIFGPNGNLERRLSVEQLRDPFLAIVQNPILFAVQEKLLTFREQTYAQQVSMQAGFYASRALHSP
jgi:hypothetical protein